MNVNMMVDDSPTSSSDIYSHSTTMLVVFFTSLFGTPVIGHVLRELLTPVTAISFPSLSKRVSFLSIPRVVFFVGKHFGTGVILSTAFVHLLQDAFQSLNDEKVQDISKVGRWTGLIVCVQYINRVHQPDYRSISA
jgi:hypothetical protein